MTIPIWYALGGQLKRRGGIVVPPPPPPPPPSGAARFPGDTRPKITGQWYWGIDEADKDPTHAVGNEGGAPESLSGTPVGAMRWYYVNGAGFGGATATIPTMIRDQHAKGRIPWISQAYRDWGTAADGRNNAAWDQFIAYVEEQVHAPVWYTMNHEPENQTTGHPKLNGGKGSGTEAQYGAVNKAFRARMWAYADAHGGWGTYKWKNLAFGPIFIAQTGARTGATTGYGVDNYMQNSTSLTGIAVFAATNTFNKSAHHLLNGMIVYFTTTVPAGMSANKAYYIINRTADTFQLATTLGGAAVSVTANATVTLYGSAGYMFDFYGCDPYIQTSTTPVWYSNWAATVIWNETSYHPYPIGASEFGVQHRDPQAATKLQQWYDKCLDGTHDIFACLYFDSDTTTDGTGNPQWILDNISNGGLLNKWVALAKDPRSIHFWDVGYTKPAGL